MRSAGGPAGHRNAYGRWQDRREDALDQPYGRARQASWVYIVALLVGAIVVAVALTWAYVTVKHDTEQPAPKPEQTTCTAPPPGAPCRQVP